MRNYGARIAFRPERGAVRRAGQDQCVDRQYPPLVSRAAPHTCGAAAIPQARTAAWPLAGRSTSPHGQKLCVQSETKMLTAEIPPASRSAHYGRTPRVVNNAGVLPGERHRDCRQGRKIRVQLRRDQPAVEALRCYRQPAHSEDVGSEDNRTRGRRISPLLYTHFGGAACRCGRELTLLTAGLRTLINNACSRDSGLRRSYIRVPTAHESGGNAQFRPATASGAGVLCRPEPTVRPPRQAC